MEKLIILSGKARSGKDTVLDIIKSYYKDKRVINISYSYYLKDYLKRMNMFDEKNKPRTLMQDFGTYLRKINKNFLINRVLEDIEVFKNYYDIIVITDARLIEEVEIPSSIYDAKSIRIERDNFDNGLTMKEKEDITETNLDSYKKFDYIIKNDENLKENIWRILWKY